MIYKVKNGGGVICFINENAIPPECSDLLDANEIQIQEYTKSQENKELKAQYVAERDKKSYENIVVDGVEYIADKEAQDNYFKTGAISALRNEATVNVMNKSKEIIKVPLATFQKIVFAIHDRQLLLWQEYSDKIKALSNS